jgi:hypothetical protein
MKTQQVAILTAGLALVAVACSSSDTPTSTATVAPTTTTAAPVFGAADALSVADAYFAGYDAGDAEAVSALFVAGAEFATNLGPQDRAGWEQVLAWNVAQGTVLEPRDCRVDGNDPGISVTLYCPHDNFDALVQAVEAEPVPINLTLVVTPDGIAEWTFLFGDPNFNVVGRPFAVWMASNHPDEAGSVGFGNWASTDEAEQNGVLTAEYAVEWASYLTENDCIYSDGC